MSLRIMLVLATAGVALMAGQAAAAPIVKNLGGRTAEIMPKLTTAGDPADYTVAPGGFSDGVADLILDVPGPFFARCTGSLLSTGRHILTAAHCVSDEFGTQSVTEGTATFRGDSGNYTYRVQNVVIHPDWDGDYLYGNDIAVIELNDEVNADINRYDIYRGTDEIGQVVDKYGYGRSGNGAEGDVLPSGTFRHGQNKYDATEALVLDAVAYPYVPGSQLWYDFDNGNPFNDAFGFYFGPDYADTGLGHDEVNSAPGDSGGPSFIGNMVAGVTSYGITFLGTPGVDIPDVTAGIDSSFGEFSVDTRVSTYAGFVDYASSFVTVPTPATLPLLAGGLLGLGWLRRRRAA